MRVIRYIGGTLVLGLAWVVLQALLLGAGFSPAGAKATGLVLAFLTSPVWMLLLHGPPAVQAAMDTPDVEEKLR